MLCANHELGLAFLAHHGPGRTSVRVRGRLRVGDGLNRSRGCPLVLCANHQRQFVLGSKESDASGCKNSWWNSMDASVDDEMDDETNAHRHFHGRPPTDLDCHGRVRICPWTVHLSVQKNYLDYASVCRSAAEAEVVEGHFGALRDGHDRIWKRNRRQRAGRGGGRGRESCRLLHTRDENSAWRKVTTLRVARLCCSPRNRTGQLCTEYRCWQSITASLAYRNYSVRRIYVALANSFPPPPLDTLVQHGQAQDAMFTA